MTVVDCSINVKTVFGVNSLEKLWYFAVTFKLENFTSKQLWKIFSSDSKFILEKGVHHKFLLELSSPVGCTLVSKIQFYVNFIDFFSSF